MHMEVHIIGFKQQVYACGFMSGSGKLWDQDAEEHMQLIKIPLPQFYVSSNFKLVQYYF